MNLMLRIFAIALLLIALATTAAAQAPGPGPGGRGGQGPLLPGGRGGRFGGIPPRDNAQTPTGTAKLSGRVIAADTGTPIRRAQISINSRDAQFNRNVTTDSEGRYELAALPAGRYRLFVNKAGYVALEYGQARPFEAGKPLDITAGQVLEKIDFSLPRGSAITGRITDEFGDPITDVQVQALRYQFLNGERQLVDAGRHGTDGRPWRVPHFRAHAGRLHHPCVGASEHAAGTAWRGNRANRISRHVLSRRRRRQPGPDGNGCARPGAELHRVSAGASAPVANLRNRDGIGWASARRRNGDDPRPRRRGNGPVEDEHHRKRRRTRFGPMAAFS